MRRFPLRTQLLMLLALAAFIRLWCVTHPPRGSEPAKGPAVEVTVQPDRVEPAPAGDALPEDSGSTR